MVPVKVKENLIFFFTHTKKFAFLKSSSNIIQWYFYSVPNVLGLFSLVLRM